jgi:hypothetical protein
VELIDGDAAVGGGEFTVVSAVELELTVDVDSVTIGAVWAIATEPYTAIIAARSILRISFLFVDCSHGKILNSDLLLFFFVFFT